jgi:hypothetical protein
MIGPGESLTDRLSAVRGDGRSTADTLAGGDAPTAARPISPARPMSPGPTQHGGPHGPMSPPPYGPHGQGPHGQGPHGQGPQGLYGQHGGQGPQGPYGATGEMPAPPWGRRQPGPSPLAGVKRAGAGLLGRVRDWPMAIRLAAAGGLAVLLVVAAFALLRDGDDPASSPPPTAGPQPTSAAAAAFATRAEAARGLTVNVPADWQRKTSGGVWVDFVDPADADRKVRILVENSSADPSKFLQSASSRLRQNAAGNCARPYNQVGLTQVEQSGQPAAELEYTCGSGASMRHGVWRAVVTGGKAYSFFLTTPDSRFAESRPVFDEMVRTFEVTAAG